MVKLDIITTRGGDAGETSLGDGARVRKDALRVEAYGTVDEANAAIGVLRLHTGEDAVADAMLARIQNDLFDIGADLCVPGEAGARLRVADTQSARLEAELAEMNGQMPALKSFVLPGGTAGAAAAHVARTVTRRAERLVVALAAEEEVNPAVIRYLNRLSDHLFVLARRLNGNGAGDVLWVPGATRGCAPAAARAVSENATQAKHGAAAWNDKTIGRFIAPIAKVAGFDEGGDLLRDGQRCGHVEDEAAIIVAIRTRAAIIGIDVIPLLAEIDEFRRDDQPRIGYIHPIHFGRDAW